MPKKPTLAEKYTAAVNRLALIQEAARKLYEDRHITELVREHFTILATSERADPHPETGLPCPSCGETHAVRTLIGESTVPENPF